MIQLSDPKITVDTAGNTEIIKNGLHEQIHLEDYIKPKIKESFLEDTENIIRSNKEYNDLKNRVRQAAQELQSSRSVRKYYDAYEIVLDARVFFMGNVADLNYILTLAINGEPVDVQIDRKQLREMIFGQKKFGLSNSGSALRFNRTALNALEAYAIEVLVTDSEFQMKSADGKMDLHFQNPGWMKRELERMKQIQERAYSFQMDIKIDKEDKAHFTVHNASGGYNTSTVFSAVGKYAIDELFAKQDMAAQNNAIYSGQINIGNLTEIYSKYKAIYNKGHNHFYPQRKTVTGGELYEIFSEVRKNTDPWYKGGDQLDNQIKSFLGSMPTLASLKSIKKTILELDEALNKRSLEETKQQISEMFIKNETKFNNELGKAETQLAKVLSENLANMMVQ